MLLGGLHKFYSTVKELVGQFSRITQG